MKYFSFHFYWMGCIVMGILSIIFLPEDTDPFPYQLGQVCMGLAALFREKTLIILEKYVEALKLNISLREAYSALTAKSKETL